MKLDKSAAVNILQGVRIVELADDIAGPYCGKLFADFGAEVIKVESSAGDQCRRRGTGRHVRRRRCPLHLPQRWKAFDSRALRRSPCRGIDRERRHSHRLFWPRQDRPRRLTPSLATFGDCGAVTVRPDRSISRQARDRVHAAGRERNHGSAGAARPTPIASRRPRLRMGPG